VRCVCFGRRVNEGTSLSDLTKAMGIKRPSLYAAYGNKEALFHKALERYVNGQASYFDQALKEPTARSVAEKLLNGAIDLMTQPRNPKGCLMVQGALVCGEGADFAREELIFAASFARYCNTRTFSPGKIRKGLTVRFRSGSSRALHCNHYSWNVCPGCRWRKPC